MQQRKINKTNSHFFEKFNKKIKKEPEIDQEKKKNENLQAY